MLEFTTGEVVTNGAGSMSIYAFYRLDSKAEERPVHLAEADSKSGLRKGTDNIVEVVPSCEARLRKTWTTRRFTEPPSGCIFKFIIRRTKPGIAFGAAMAAVLIRARASGPLQRIEIDAPYSAGCAKSRLYIEGRFDILDEALYDDLGIERAGAKRRSDIEQMDNFLDADYMRIIVLEKAIAPAAKAKLKRVGGGKVMTKIRRTRRVSPV